MLSITYRLIFIVRIYLYICVFAIYSDDEEESTTRKPKKEKKVGPKGKVNSYSFFVKEYSAQLKEEFPDMDLKDSRAKISEKWKALTPEEKAPFEKLAAEDATRYEAEKADMIAKGLMPPDEEKPSKKRKKRDGDATSSSRKRKKTEDNEGDEDDDDEDEDGDGIAKLDTGVILNIEGRSSRSKLHEMREKSNQLDDWRKVLFKENDITSKPGTKSGEYEFVG